MAIQSSWDDPGVDPGPGNRKAVPNATISSSMMNWILYTITKVDLPNLDGRIINLENEVALARGSKTSLNERLSVALNDDGTPKFYILNKGNQSSLVTETTPTLKQEVTPDLNYITYVEGIHIVANNPSGSGCTLYFELKALLDDGSEISLSTGNSLAEGDSFDDWLVDIMEDIPNNKRIKAIRLYTYCSAAPTTGYEPSIKIERVTGVQN